MRKEPFTKANAHLAADFDCGAKGYAVEVSDWIKGVRNEVWEAIRLLGVQVWLYLTDEGDLIGFGSLGLQEVKLDAPEQVLGQLLTIPYYGLRTKYHKKPEGAWQQYYSRQIFRDLFAEARRHPFKPSRLALYVHPKNTGAIRLYEDPEFAFRKQGTFEGDICMIKDLSIPDSPAAG